MSEHSKHRNHHRHRHIDESERAKQKNLSARKRRKIMANIAFTTLCILATVIIAFVLWLYMPGA